MRKGGGVGGNDDTLKWSMYYMDILRNSVGNAALMEVQDRAHSFSCYSLKSL